MTVMSVNTKGASSLDKWFDFYRCQQGGTIMTTLARYGNDGPDYFSFADVAFIHVQGIPVQSICGALAISERDKGKSGGD